VFGLGKSKSVVGLDIGSSAVKAVELKAVGKGFKVVAFAMEPVPPDSIVDGAIIDGAAVADAIRRVFENKAFKTKEVAASLSGNAVIVKKINLPVMTEAELAESIYWEAEQYIPFDLAEVQLDYQVLPDDPSRSTTEVLLVAAKKDRIEERADAIVRAGRQPVILDLEAFALVNAYQANHGDRNDPLTVLVHAGRAGTIVCLLERGQLAFTRDIALGGQTHTDALMRDLDVAPATAERLKHPGRPLVPGVDPKQVTAILVDVTTQLVAEISKSIDFHRATSPVERITRIVLSGGACGMEALAALLGSEFGAPVEVFDPFLKIARAGRRPAATDGAGPAFAVAVGLAMRQDGAA